MFKKVKTVDSILATFTNMVQELYEIEASKNEEASNLRDQATLLSVQASAKEEEAKRAASVAGKINQIIE